MYVLFNSSTLNVYEVMAVSTKSHTGFLGFVSSIPPPTFPTLSVVGEDKPTPVMHH